ncbi:MAG: MFS transporter [Pirellulales bacterium]|nr:MFS transporter [Pirellulales bacterium]
MSSPTPNSSSSSRGAGKEIFAWAMYDWANSAYSTLLITIVVGYLTKIVFSPDDTWGPTVYAWSISASMFLAALLSPVLGAVADANSSKRKWLAGTALLGSAAAVAMAAVPPQSVALIVGFFFLMSLCFELSLGFYNGFLPEIADERTINLVSAWGYALGYLGGALALVIAMLVIRFGERLGMPDVSDQLRIGILVLGLWWGLFSLPTLWILRDRAAPPSEKQPLPAAARDAFRQVGRTLANVRRYRILALFLLGYLFYNDGIQTVLSQASVFATETPELRFSVGELSLLVLMIQLVAMPGAMLVGWLADLWGQKSTLMYCLAVWVGLLVAAFLVQNKIQFWVLGGILALVMGGTQSVSRSIMGLMTPPARTAEFFGFFNLSGKATSFLGTFLFGAIFKITGDPRLAILSLLVFFLLGWAIVARINVVRGQEEALLDSSRPMPEDQTGPAT